MSSRPASAPQPPRLSTDQKRAQWAWDCVKGGVSSDYAKLTKDVPALIMGSGLLQTLAYLLSKEDGHRVLLFKQLCGRLALLPDPIGKLTDGRLSPAQYRAYTEEALALLRWLRHFADVARED